MKENWVDACSTDDIDREDLIRFDYEGKIYAIYRSPEDEYYATDGLCTHEDEDLSAGMVFGHIIECPKHNGRFDYRSGEAKQAPACVNLATYPTKIDNGRVLINLAQ